MPNRSRTQSGERETVPAGDLVRRGHDPPIGVDRAPEADPDGGDRLAGHRPARRAGGPPSRRSARGCPPAPAAGSIARRSRRQDATVAASQAELELGAADLDAEEEGLGHRGQAARAVGGDGAGDAAVEVVDDPVEDDLVQRLDDPHVVDRDVDVVLGQTP